MIGIIYSLSQINAYHIMMLMDAAVISSKAMSTYNKMPFSCCVVDCKPAGDSHVGIKD